MQALVQWVSILGVPKNIRTVNVSQIHQMEKFRSTMNFHYTVVGATTVLAQRLMTWRMNVIKYHKALVFEQRVKDRWSQLLPSKYHEFVN
jgi:hypothetical protein